MNHLQHPILCFCLGDQPNHTLSYQYLDICRGHESKCCLQYLKPPSTHSLVFDNPRASFTDPVPPANSVINIKEH